MIPIVTPEEMAAVDAAAPEPVEVLVDRAARAVARTALEMLGGSYGRRVVVVAGPGNNGADGRVAAGHLERRGVRCAVVAPFVDDPIPCVDLVIDAAFGTGLSRPYAFPEVLSDPAVLAVDIPSGVDGRTGERLGAPIRADLTITFAALKPALLFEPGRALSGEVRVADIGLDVGDPGRHLVVDADVAGWLPATPADHHKWRSAVRIVAGSPGMTGAAHLAASAAQRSGAGYVQLASPGLDSDPGAPTEAVGRPLPAEGWADDALADLDRVGALLVGPGLGGGDPVSTAAMAAAPCPLVLDGDALTADTPATIAGRAAPTVITPHDGEWRRLGGSPDADRIAATASFARASGAVVIRKGPTTVVAGPDGRVRVVATGDARLATAGTGDVLAGVTVALLGRGLDPFDAATAAAHLHGRAGAIVGDGLVAGDLPAAIPDAIASVRGDAR